MTATASSPATPAPAGSPAVAPERIGRLLNLVLWLGAILAGGYHLGLELATLRLPAPMGSWETVYAAIAQVWPDQYQWAHYVEGHDGYGPGYPTFVRPFLLAGLEVYLAHRLANLVAILLAGVLVVRLLLKQGCPPAVTAGVAAIFYALNAGSYSIQARPDFLVLLAITALLALGEAVARGRLKPGAVFGALFGGLALAAFLTKAYALFTWGAVLAYLAVFVNLRQTLIAGAVGGAILGAGIGIFATLNPLYTLEVFQGQVVQAAPSFAWLGHQTADFSWLAGGLLATAIVPLALATGRRAARRLAEPAGPVPTAANSERYWRWQTLLAALGLLAGPGWHTGAYLTYFLHLLLVPVVVLAGLQAAKSGPIARLWIGGALLANLAVLTGTAPAWPGPDPGWAELRHDILNQPGRVAVDYLMAPIAREKKGILVVSTGQTGYTLKEPFLMSDNSATVTRARDAATRYLRDQARELFGERPMDAIYLDCHVLGASGGPPGKSAAVPRNELAHFTGPAMNAYVAVKAYDIRPYYFATNAPRQTAGTLQTTILKFVRKK